MNNKELKKGFNQSVNGKKTNRLAMILITSFATIITLTTLVLYMFSNINIAGKIKVADLTGRYIETELKYKKDLIMSGIQSHVDKAVFYANSGDQNSLRENQAKTLFLMNRSSAYSVFENWKKKKTYYDILQQGHIYTVSNVKVTNLNADKEPYIFKSEAILEIKDGIRSNYWKIKSEGYIKHVTPSFPNNEWGYQIYNYTQDYIKLEENE